MIYIADCASRRLNLITKVCRRPVTVLTRASSRERNTAGGNEERSKRAVVAAIDE